MYFDQPIQLPCSLQCLISVLSKSHEFCNCVFSQLVRDTRKNECTKNNEVRCFDSTKQFTRIMLITQGLVLRQKCALLPLLYHRGGSDTANC